ncbi:MAG: hypothetical protein U1F15_15370 [Burkholderiales bacterium]
MHAQHYAQAWGVPRFLVQLALIFIPMFLAIPLTYLFVMRSLIVQASAALAMGVLLAGYAAMAIDCIAWFTGAW